MRSVVIASKMRHAVQAGKGCGVALVAMIVKFLLGEDVAASLESEATNSRVSDRLAAADRPLVGGASYLTGEGDHCWLQAGRLANARIGS